MRFIRRWKYTLSMIFCIIIPSVIMLFFGPTRLLGEIVLVVLWLTTISVIVEKVR